MTSHGVSEEAVIVKPLAEEPVFETASLLGGGRGRGVGGVGQC